MWSALPSIVLVLFVGLAFFGREASSTTRDDHDSILDAPSLHLRVDLFGSNMEIHGQPSFDVFANPIVSTDGTSVRYDGFAHFIEEDTQFTYILVDGASYVVTTVGNSSTSVASQSVRCHSSAIPFASALPALNDVRVVPGAVVWGEPVKCPSGPLFQTSFGEETLVLCAWSASELKILGETIMVTVSYLDSPIRPISAPTLSDQSTSCDTVDTTATVTPIAIALLTGKATAPSAMAPPAMIETESRVLRE